MIYAAFIIWRLSLAGGVRRGIFRVRVLNRWVGSR
jgi:hypothetical protein